MMAKKSERPRYGFRKRGFALWPDMALDARMLESFAEGELVHVEIKTFRNNDRLRAYFAMLNDVIEATDCALSPEKLHELVKLETGCVDLVRLPSGMTVALPGSVAFDRMTETEFHTYFRRAEQWLAQTYGFIREERAACQIM